MARIIVLVGKCFVCKWMDGWMINVIPVYFVATYFISFTLVDSNLIASIWINVEKKLKRKLRRKKKIQNKQQ